MKTLGAWIAGIFALGLAVGSIVSGSSPLAETELETAVDTAPLVDCGEGREALLEPVDVGGTRSLKVRCVPSERETSSRARALAPTAPPAPQPVTAVTPPPVTTEAPVRTPDPAPPPDDEGDGRTWKESAVIIGGAAGAGAGIGAIAKGKKGAAVGAAIGAASGTAYELIKRDKN